MFFEVECVQYALVSQLYMGVHPFSIHGGGMHKEHSFSQPLLRFASCTAAVTLEVDKKSADTMQAGNSDMQPNRAACNPFQYQPEIVIACLPKIAFHSDSVQQQQGSSVNQSLFLQLPSACAWLVCRVVSILVK